MRKYFIDYFQLWIPIGRIEVKDKNLKDQIISNISRNLFDNRIKEYIIKLPHLNLKSFYHAHFLHGGLIFHLKGNYFENDNFLENLKQVFDTIELIYKYHKNDLDFRKATISRIDIACNLPFFLKSNSFKIKTEAQNSLKYFQWYIGNQKKINLNGIQIGKRGSKGLQLSVYDKRYSPNKYDDHRFQTKNYTRLEYRIGRNYLKGGVGISSLKDLRKYEERFPKEIISYCRKRCDLYFVDEKGSDHYYTYKDFENSVGLEVDDPNQEGIRIEMKDLSKSIN